MCSCICSLNFMPKKAKLTVRGLRSKIIWNVIPNQHSEKKLSKIRYFILGNLEKSHLRYGNNILNKKKCTPVR